MATTMPRLALTTMLVLSAGPALAQGAPAQGAPPGVVVEKVAKQNVRPSIDFTGRVKAVDKVDCNLHAVSLKAQSQLTVFRLVQEALTNITKYAKAGLVHVSLTCEGDDAVVSVEDDGVGFDTATPQAGSYGLLGMRYRIEGDGGCLMIASTPGIGTRVSATLPLEALV